MPLQNTRTYLHLLICLLIMAPLALPQTAKSNQGERDYFKRAITRDPNDLQAHLNYQRASIKLGNEATLKEEYRTYLNTSPQSAQFLYLYGRLLTSENQKRVYLHRAIEADSTFFQAQFDLGKLHYYAGEYNDAIVRYRKAVRLKPTSAVTANYLGLAYYHSGYPKQAIVAYQKALQNDDTYKDAYLNLGLSYYYTHQYDQAIQTYLTALKKAKWDHDKHLLYHTLGHAYRKMNNIPKAIEAYQQALTYNPNYTEAHISLGNVALFQNNYTQAIQAYQNALGTSAETAGLHLSLALAYFNTQAYPKAITHFQHTLAQDTTHIQTYHYLGRAYYLNNQPEKAMQILEQFIQKEKRREKRAQVAEAKRLIYTIKKERFTKILD